MIGYTIFNKVKNNIKYQNIIYFETTKMFKNIIYYKTDGLIFSDHNNMFALINTTN